MFAAAPFARAPWAAPSGPDESVLPVFTDLLENEDLLRRFILKARLWDLDAGELVDVGYGAGEGFETRFFRPFLVDALQFESRLWSSLTQMEPAGVPTVGEIGIAIADGEDDALCGYGVDGRDIEVDMGGYGFTLNQYHPVFVGTAEFSRWDLTRFSIAARDVSSKVDKLLQTERYAGTGGLEGGDDIKGRVKPRWYGPRWNVPGVMVDRLNLIVQFAAHEMNDIADVFDRAEPYTIDSDVADEAALYASTPATSHAVTCKAIGCAKLGSEPLGACTADGEGYVSAAYGYVDTAPDIAKVMFIDQGGLPETSIDLAAFAALAVAQPARVGIFVGDEMQLMDAARAVLRSIFAVPTFTRTGFVTCSRFELDTPVDEITESEIIDIRALAPEPASWRRSIGYRRAELVQTGTEVSAAATDARKDFVSQEYRRATWEDAAILDDHPLAQDVTIDTLLADESDAQDEADRQGALLGPLVRPYEVIVRSKQFRLRAGQTVTLSYPRFGLDAGKDAIIVTLGENTTTQQTRLMLSVPA